VFVVAAVAGHPGIPPLPTRYGQPATLLVLEPVGTRHAVGSMTGAASVQRAMCGADIRGWLLFPRLAFSPAHGAGCQRCGQLVFAAEATPARRPISDGAWPAFLDDEVRPEKHRLVP
jgi:hypothetical protein